MIDMFLASDAWACLQKLHCCINTTNLDTIYGLSYVNTSKQWCSWVKPLERECPGAAAIDIHWFSGTEQSQDYQEEWSPPKTESRVPTNRKRSSSTSMCFQECKPLNTSACGRGGLLCYYMSGTDHQDWGLLLQPMLEAVLLNILQHWWSVCH